MSLQKQIMTSAPSALRGRGTRLPAESVGESHAMGTVFIYLLNIDV